MNCRRPAIRTRVLRWLLVMAVLAGAGVLQGGHCLTHTAPLATAMTGTLVAAHMSTAEPGAHERPHVHSSVAQHTSTTADDCHLQPAPSTAATITSGTLAPPPTAIRMPPVPAPVPARKPRAPVAVALTAIGISRI